MKLTTTRRCRSILQNLACAADCWRQTDCASELLHQVSNEFGVHATREQFQISYQLVGRKTGVLNPANHRIQAASVIEFYWHPNSTLNLAGKLGQQSFINLEIVAACLA